MLGYLLSGDAAAAFSGLSARLGCQLEIPMRYAGRPGRFSTHIRSVPAGKPYAKGFRCHHLIMVFAGVARTTGTDDLHAVDELPTTQ